MGIDADPITSREHILIAKILEAVWSESRSLNPAGLIHAIQAPPFERIGVLDLEMFYPAKERFSLAMRMNNLQASPGFESWMEGDPLNIGRMLYTAPRENRALPFLPSAIFQIQNVCFLSPCSSMK